MATVFEIEKALELGFINDLEKAMKDDKEPRYEKPDYEALANEEYFEEEPVGLEDLVLDEETGEYEYPDEDSFRMDRLQAKFMEKESEESDDEPA